VTRGQAGKSGVLCDYTAADESRSLLAAEPRALDASRDAAAVLWDLDRLFPGTREAWNGKAVSSKPFLDPNLGLAYSVYKVGQRSIFGGYPAVAQGSCRFAGEHTSESAQGYMEGGAESG